MAASSTSDRTHSTHNSCPFVFSHVTKLNSFLKFLLFLIVVLGVHCSIYECSYKYVILEFTSPPSIPE
jgi:hypothetical protein